MVPLASCAFNTHWRAIRDHDLSDEATENRKSPRDSSGLRECDKDRDAFLQAQDARVIAVRSLSPRRPRGEILERRGNGRDDAIEPMYPRLRSLPYR